MRADPSTKFRWFYRGNPLGEAQAFLLEVSGETESAVVGCCGLGERTLYVDGRPLRAGLLADFAVDKEHRTVRPALIVQRALSEYARQHYDLTYGFPNESAIGVLNRVGLPLLGRMGRYVRVLKYKPLLERYVRPIPLAAMGGLVADSFTRVAESGRAAPLSRRLRLDWVGDADSRFDSMWDDARRHYRCIGDRSQQFLRWRFFRREGSTAALAISTQPSGREILAYAAIVEKDPGVALVADFLARSPAELAALFRLLWPALRSRGFKSAVTFFLGSADVARALTSAGFTFRHPSKFVVSAVGDTMLVERGAVEDVNNWYLTEADRDN
jgi:hypothetical protein